MIPYLLTCTARGIEEVQYCSDFVKTSSGIMFTTHEILMPRNFAESHHVRFPSWNKQELRRHRPIRSLSVLVVRHATDVSLCIAEDGPN